MGSAESRQEVVERSLIGEIDYRETKTPFVTITMKQIVISHSSIEKAAGLDARRIVVVVFGSRRGDLDERGTVLRRGASG